MKPCEPSLVYLVGHVLIMSSSLLQQSNLSSPLSLLRAPLLFPSRSLPSSSGFVALPRCCYGVAQGCWPPGASCPKAPENRAVTPAKTEAPHPFGVQEQSVPRPAQLWEASRRQTFRRPRALRLKTTYNLIAPQPLRAGPGDQGDSCGLSSTTYLPGPLKTTQRCH